MKNSSFGKAIIILLLSINLVITVSLLLIFVPRVSAATGCFPDTNGHWAETYICWMSDNGIAGGYPDGTYRPENTVTRAEMAVMMKNLADGYETRISELETFLASASLENGGDDLVFTGVNVHVRDGSGDTDGSVNGLGNLIVGYNEDVGNNEIRTGSHNLIIGTENSYTSFGGLVAGNRNTISGMYSFISGGELNSASGSYSSISGGRSNTASDPYSFVSGGESNTASGQYSSISGGYDNIASGNHSSISGGYDNTASGEYSSISGGDSGSVSGIYDWRAGTLFQDE